MRRLIITIIICLLTTSLHAGGVGTTGGQFLKIGVGAKPLATGGAFGTISDDANALYYNPAGIGRVGGLEILSTYGMWYQDIYYGYLGAVKSLPGLKSSIGVSAMYMGADNIPSYDETGIQPEDEPYHSAVNMGFGVTWAFNLGNNLSVGVTGKYIDSTLETVQATAMDFDIGVRFSAGPGIVLGASVQNVLESEVKFISEGYPLSRNIRAGIGYKINTMMVGVDVNVSSEGGMGVKFGGEYVYNNIVFLRGGYNMPLGGSLDFFSGISVGGGLSFNKILVDYALVPHPDLGLTHRVSLTLKL